MGKRGYTAHVFQPNWGVGKRHPREVPAGAPTCRKLESDGLERCPQPMQSTDTFYLSFLGKDPPF